MLIFNSEVARMTDGRRAHGPVCFEWIAVCREGLSWLALMELFLFPLISRNVYNNSTQTVQIDAGQHEWSKDADHLHLSKLKFECFQKFRWFLTYCVQDPVD